MAGVAGPSPGEPSGAGSAPSGLDRPNDGDEDGTAGATPDPEPPADVPVSSDQPGADAGGAPVAPVGGDDDGDLPAPSVGQTAVACTENGGGCLVINIAVSDVDADACIQLALDNCERSAQPGLPVDLPVSWRLGAASLNRASDECVPGAPFDPRFGSAIVDASGTIAWNLTTRVPSELVLDVTLEPSSTALDSTPVRVTNSDLVEQLLECD